jgi:hypothetical protein
MARRPEPPRPTASILARPASRQGRPGIVHTSLYLPEAIHQTLRVAAHSIVLEGIELALRKRARKS